jgi:hypothetical protein
MLKKRRRQGKGEDFVRIMGLASCGLFSFDEMHKKVHMLMINVPEFMELTSTNILLRSNQR